MARTTPGSRGSLRFYAILSLTCLLISLLLLVVMVWKADTLAANGLTGMVFYVLLIPLGLSNAGFLFGVMHSVAAWRGQQLGGRLVLGGPIVAVVLTVLGGFQLPAPTAGAFAVTVFVHGPGGPQDIVLAGTGQVLMDLHGRRQAANIDQNGAAFFPGIPGDLRGQGVPIFILAPGFEPVDARPRKLIGDTIYLPVRKSAGRFHGIVTNADNRPVPGATVDIEGITSTTGDDGRFDMQIPPERVTGEMDLRVGAPGYMAQNHMVAPGGSEIQIQLEKDHQ